MKKISMLVLFVLVFSTTSYAQLKVIGKGENLSIDTSEFPPRMQAAYDLMKQKCSKCHTIERVIASVQTGVCLYSKTSFTKDTAKSIVARMFLKPDSNITRDDARTIVELLHFMLEQNADVAQKF
jgi:Photosystem P840 reaction-centre cytochrome c-551